MPKRANRRTNPLSTNLFRIPNGTIYKPTAAIGGSGAFGARLPVTRTKGQAGYYSTGPGEYKNDLTIGGTRVRMGPNSTITPAGPPQTQLQKLFGGLNTILTGNQDLGSPSGTTSVQGSVQPGGGGKNARLAQLTKWGTAGGGVNVGGFDAGNQSVQLSPGIFSQRRMATNVGMGAGSGLTPVPGFNPQASVGGYGYQAPGASQNYFDLAAQNVQTNLQAFNGNPAYTSAAPGNYSTMATTDPFSWGATPPPAGWGPNGWQGAAPQGFSVNKGGGLVQKGIKGNNWKFKNGVTYAVNKWGGGGGGTPAVRPRPQDRGLVSNTSMNWRFGAG